MSEGSERSGHLVLVVDDDDSSRDIARRYLSVEHDVIAVESGVKALDALRSEAVDLVLLDVMLPELGGYEICRRVKQAGAGSYLPVLLLTALGEHSDRIEGLRAGADDFLRKPVDRHELRLRVNTFLRLRKQDLTIRSQVEELTRLQGLKDDLVALVAHDLRNPLAGLEGHLELLGKQLAAIDDPAIAKRVGKIRSSATKFRGLIDGILEVRLLEERRLPVDRAPTPIVDVLAEAVAIVEGAAVVKGIELRLDVARELVGPLDRRLVTRAIANLLSNAVRHSSDGTTVDVVGRGVHDAIAIEVSDRGEGVPHGLRTDLFEKFRTSAERGGLEPRGYGLGLYLVKLVADAHGGTVTVADRDGGGTTFTLTLPASGGPRGLANHPVA